MRADWTPEAEARLRETYPRMVECPPPAVHSDLEQRLNGLLDDLGSDHKKPFVRSD